MTKKFIAVFALTCLLAFTALYAATKYKIDKNHSTVGFDVPIVNGIAKVTGKFMDFAIDVDWNDEDPSASTVYATIEVNSITTGIEARDNHLKSADFFDVENYPQITFQSKDIMVNGGMGYTLTGTLTMHGVSRELSLLLLVDEYASPEDGHVWKAFTVVGKLNRRDFGINWEHNSVPFFVGDEIGIDISVITR